MARYNKNNTILKGNEYVLKRIRVKQSKASREDGDLKQVSNILDDFSYVFGGDISNIVDSNGVQFINTNTIKTNTPVVESKEVTKILQQLQSDKFFDVVSDKVNHPNNAINKAIDFNNKINYTKQSVSTHASLTNINNAYEKFKNMKEIGKGQLLYIFDTETVGGKDASKVWSPLGITEFAMQKVNLENNKTSATNIVLGIAPTKENTETYEKIIGLIKSGNTDKIMENEKLRVTAMRLGLYGNEATKLTHVPELGYSIAESLADANSNNWLNEELITKGWNANVNAYTNSTKTAFGLNSAEKAFIDSIAEMNKAANSGYGMIAGQNFMPFDMPVVNSEIQRIRARYAEAVYKGVDGRLNIDANSAKKALAYIDNAFGTSGGFSIPTDSVFDTLPLFSAIRDRYGIDPLLNNNKDIIKLAGNGTARQEHIGAAWFPKLFESGDAHRADFDVTVLNNMLTNNLEQLNNKTLIEYFMEDIGQEGLKNVNLESTTIKANRQLFHAKNSSASMNYTGKSILDYTFNKSTGEVFTGSNYEMIGNIPAKFNGDINMGTNIVKNQFYYVEGIKKINANDLPKDLGKVMPGHSSPELYQLQLKMAVSNKNKNSGYEDLIYTYHFNSEYELSGFMSSNFGLTAYMDDADNWIINGDDAYDVLETGILKDGLIERNPDFRNLNTDDIIDKGIENANERLRTDRAVRSITDSDKSYDKIKAQIKMRDKLSKAGLNDVTQEEISMILAGNPIRDMSDAQAKNITKQMRDIAGFKPNKTGPTKLYSNTARNITSSWDLLSSQDPFMKTVINNLDTYSKNNKLNKEQTKLLFNNVIENLKTNVATQLYDSPEEVRNAVLNSRNFVGSIYEYKGRYDVELPAGFRLEQPKIKNVVSLRNLDGNKDILSFDINNKSASYNLVNSLSKAKYGDLDLSINPERYKREALYDFVTSLNKTDKNFKTKNIKNIINHMADDFENFSLDYVAREVIDTMKTIKSNDPYAGILKTMSVRTLDINTDFVNLLNKSTSDDVIKAINNLPTPISIPRYDSQKYIKNYVSNNIMKHYMPDKKIFDATLKGLSSEQSKQMQLLYNSLENDISKHISDIVNITSRINGGALSVDGNGRLIFSQGDRAITFDSIPKIKLDGNNLYAQIGETQKVGVHLDVAFDKAGKQYLTNNLGENFRHNGLVTKTIKKKINDGTYKMEDLASITSYISKEVREQSAYDFKSGDIFANYYVGTKELDTMIPRLFAQEGDLKDIGDNIKIPENIRQKLLDKLSTTKEIEAGGLDPVISQIISPYRINILRSLATEGSDVASVLEHVNTATKDKSKLGKGILLGGNIRYETGVMNSFENLARPVVYGSGNVHYLNTKNIENTAKNALGTFFEGSLFESDVVNSITRKKVEGVGKLSTNFTSRTAYVGQNAITTLIENNYNKVMNANSITTLTKDKKENIYNMLHGVLNTFEQQKVFSARVFDQMTNGSMAANTQRLSSAKDLVGAINIDSDTSLYERLFNIMGEISVNKNGELVYKSSAGEIVKRGETIIPYAKYGGGSENFTSKMHRGLLNFNVKTNEGVKLTDEQVSKILNKNINMFSDIDISNKAQTFKIFQDIFKDYDTSFNVEDINKITLPKILINESEKSMNHLVYARIGSIDDRIAKVLSAYGDETKELIGATVPTRQALEAYFSNQTKRVNAIREGGFRTWKSFLEAVDKEAFTLDDLVFGKGGIFEGFTDIGNDNILGHGNKASMMVGSLNEAISMVGKYSNNGIESEAGRIKGLEYFVDLYNSKSDEYKFFRTSEGKGINLSVVNNRLRLDGVGNINENLDNFDMIDAKRLENAFREMDKFLESKNAPLSDRLIHDLDGEELIGRAIYDKEGEGAKVIGSSGLGSHKIVIDPETQSGISQEYFDAKKDLMNLKAQKQTLENRIKASKGKDKGAINELQAIRLQIDNKQEYISNLESTGHGMRIGDQERNILKNYTIEKINYDNIEKNIQAGKYSEEAVRANEALRGINRNKYNDYAVYDFMLKELDSQMYFNPYEEFRLTKDVLRHKDYSHLKEVYEDIVEGGISKKLGVDSAQKIYDLRMVEAANQFNNPKAGHKILSNQDLLDMDFISMTPKDYINNFGNPNSSTYESMVKKNVLLELDLGDTKKYVAVPGMGSILENAEIKQDWHKQAGRLVRTYQDEYLGLMGSEVGRDEVIMKMSSIIDDISDSTASYLTKGTEAHKMAQRQVYAAADRTKIMSTMNTENNPLLKKAQVDGKSLAEWASEKVYYDYSFDSLEAFEKRGYFTKEYLNKANMTREQMIDYLQTHGTVMIDDRYPNIIDTSLIPVRHYLNPNYQATNSTLMAPHTALKMNADSDGDSVSRFLVKYKNKDYLDYNIARTRVLETIKDQEFANDATRERVIKNLTMKEGKLSSKVYDAFRGMDIKIAQDAYDMNQDWQEKVIAKWNKDNDSVKIAQAIKNKDGLLQAEVVGGESILGTIKLPVLSQDPTFEITNNNLEEVNNILRTIQNKSHLLNETKYADILNGATDIVTYNNESKTLDLALTAINDLSKIPESGITSDIAGDMERAAIKRIRIGKYHEEAMSKLGITATGNVNATLYGISQATKNYYGNVGTEQFDRVKRDIVSVMAYEMEQAPISSKKIVVKAGDTRLMDFTDIFNNIKRYGVTDDHRKAMTDWISTYMESDKIEGAYKSLVRTAGIEKPLTNTQEIVDYMSNTFINVVGEAYDRTGPMRAEVDLLSTFGRRSGNSNVVRNAQGVVNTSSSNAGAVIGTISGINTTQEKIPQIIAKESSDTMARNAAKEAMDQIQVKPSAVNSAIESLSNTNIKLSGKSALGTSVALSVVGLAAGLIAAGYASGNPLNDANAENITKENQSHQNSNPQMSFSNTSNFGSKNIASNNTGGYIINIKGDTKKGNRELKKALRQATRNSIGPASINMNVKTTQSGGSYTNQDIENILSNYF